MTRSQEFCIHSKTHVNAGRAIRAVLSIYFPKEAIQGVSKNLLESGAHSTLFWIHLLDVQGVGTYLFTDFLFLIVQVLILKMKKAYYTCIV